jgi:uncharacterized phiE125 gp8 family phage protein
MRYSLLTLTPPVSEPVSLALAKAHLRIDHDEENELIEAWIPAARELTEAYTGKRWGEQSLRMTMAGFPPSGVIEFPIEPVSAVTKLSYLASNGATVTYANEAAVTAAFQVWLDGSPPLLAPLPLATWPVTESGRLNALTVEFTAGGGEVPEMVRSAILLTLGYWDGNRGDRDGSAPATSLGLPQGAKRLLDLLTSGSYIC